jgi:hypothetical protein
MALLIVFVGIIQIAGAAVVWLVPTIRNAEDLLPDHEAQVALPIPAELDAGPVAADR